MLNQPYKSYCQALMSLVLLLLFSSCATQVAPPQPKVIQGILDLRNWDLARDGPVRLDGDWAFYWDASRSSITQTKSEFIRVPGTWLSNHPARGKAVYHVRILSKPGNFLYGMKIYEFPQSYRLYLGNQQLLENGKYSETPELNKRSLVRPYVVFANSSASINIFIEVVNNDEDEPGPRRSIIFGLESDVRKVQDNQLISDTLVIGVLLIMALYHLGLYLQRRREMGSLLFGLLCLVMIFRIAVTEEHYLMKYFPHFPAHLEHTFDTFSFFVLAPVFAWIFSYFFEQDFQKWALKAISGIFIVFSIIYLLIPAPFLFNFYLLFTLVIGIYLLSVLYLGVKRRRSGSGVFLAGFLLFVATTIWDILSYSNIVRTIYVSQIGFVGFIFAQAYVLSMRFNQALFTSEQLTHNLENLVTERTFALEESNRKLAALNITDALTGIANRRHFDDMLQLEWSRGLRNQRPLALLMLDVDHFKNYNNCYGHQAGDTCLQNVTQILSGTVHRAGDTVARYGGEEFVILLPECSSQEAFAFAEKVRQKIERTSLPHEKSGTGIVSVSVGVHSMIPSETSSSSELIKTSDEALYKAKSEGRNRVVLA